MERPVRVAGALQVRAYPRSRGGTEQVGNGVINCMGLSPLARGNPAASLDRGRREGPIPARAGEPASIQSRHRRAWAYPRSRGGTGLTSAPPEGAQGLSPLARGNRFLGLPWRWCAGPIPARAGEPSSSSASTSPSRAYPRSRGGTKSWDVLNADQQGLSPLARGNRG